MMRFLSLFLTFNILICYGGFCRDSFAVTAAPQAKMTSGCHGMSHEKQRTGEENTARAIKDSDSPNKSCCQEVLTNTFPDLNAKVEVVFIDRTKQKTVIQDKNYLDQLRDNSLREHDPPDLQVSNSTFLL